MGSWLSSVPGGLVSGAIVGLIFGVLFEDPLKKLLRAGVRRLRRMITRSAVPLALGREFRLGPLHAPCLILEGDGTHVLKPERINVLVNSVGVQLPEEMARWRAEIAAEQERRRSTGEESAWNGAMYAVEDLVISRSGPNEEPDVTLILKHSDYYTFLATQRLDRRFPGGATPRSLYLDGREPRQIPDFMRSSFGINMAVVTADNWLVVSRRSPRTATGQDMWAPSVNESLSPDKDSVDGAPPDLFRAARRGMREELHLEDDQYDLRLLAFHLATSLSQWGVMFLTRLGAMSRAEFEAHLSRGIEDGWEHRAIDYVPLKPDSVLRYLLRSDRRNNWTPAGPALYYLTLVNTYGRRQVDAALGRVLHDLS
ncbi:hypothetical protein M8C17_02070 [Micromonospora sp. RHAY321]|uniref:hypothetical protein n=1 Tax=Micromonospora sp. RHAY321 TaxID=2944807 RepID=UPI00207C1B74|nr:hypothetical protein [Micromonospora sp. RHAY321]MCO1593941.1 hypothetical protein [Micromonospora sp. RHAY321]